MKEIFDRNFPGSDASGNSHEDLVEACQSIFVNSLSTFLLVSLKYKEMAQLIVELQSKILFVVTHALSGFGRLACLE